MTGIYALIWDCNNYVYVGQSVNIHIRTQTHIRELKNNSHINKKLQNVFNKYGLPSIKILEDCPQWMLTDMEQYWIDYYSNH